jgi:mono/diheme cytochrome c family protein
VWKYARAISALLLICLPGRISSGQEKTEPAAASAIPPEETKRANPVKATLASIADGKKMYVTQCAMCHGAGGDGKGDLAADMNLKLHDYRDSDSLKDRTDGELFYILSKGKGDMPSEEDRLTSSERWNLINYIRSLGKAKTPAAEKHEKPR